LTLTPLRGYDIPGELEVSHIAKLECSELS